MCDPEVAAPYADTVLSMVKGFDEAIEGDLDALAVKATDDQTLVVELSSPCTYFDSLAAFATLSPVQQATIVANGDSWAVDPETYVSNGPFMITEWEPSSYIITAKNPYYWNADAIKLDSIKWNLIEDANASYYAYQNGEVLFIKDVPTEEIPSLQDNDEFHVDPIIGTYYLSFNTQVEPLDNPLVRKALSLAIDREYVALEGDDLADHVLLDETEILSLRILHREMHGGCRVPENHFAGFQSVTPDIHTGHPLRGLYGLVSFCLSPYCNEGEEDGNDS